MRTPRRYEERHTRGITGFERGLLYLYHPAYKAMSVRWYSSSQSALDRRESNWDETILDIETPATLQVLPLLLPLHPRLRLLLLVRNAMYLHPVGARVIPVTMVGQESHLHHRDRDTQRGRLG